MVTTEQITTFYLYLLEELLPSDEAEDLVRRVHEEERIRERNNEVPLTRTKVHRMALETNLSEMVYAAKLRAMGLEPHHHRRPVAERLSLGVRDRLGDREGRSLGQRGEQPLSDERRRATEQSGQLEGPKKKETRICDHCGVRGHNKKFHPSLKKGGGE